MLSKFDDYPIHQSPEPIMHSATSDKFTYDRYWYNGHTDDGGLYFGIGMGRYPNLGILDCAFSVVYEGTQYAFHGSRRAPDEPTNTSVGPFAIHILEPMGRHRVVIAPNDTGIECDLIFTPRTGVMQENRQTLRNDRHITMDVTRMDQFGFWQGSIRCGDKEIIVDGAKTYGLKDRSWGIRPVGEPYTGDAPIEKHSALHFMWLPIHWDDHCSLAGLFEDDQGHQWHNDQVFLPNYTPGEIPNINDPSSTIWQGTVKHQLEFKSGTRQMSSAMFTMNDKSGESKEISIEPLLLFRMKGIGYQHLEWSHGKWKGELEIGGESWKCDDQDPISHENMHIQQVIKARCGDKTGIGVLEQIHIGPYKPYDLNGWFDGAI